MTDDLNLPQQTVESRGSARSEDLATPKSPDRPPSQAPQAVPRPSQPSSQQRPMPSSEHIPTLADGVVLKMPFNLLTYLPILAVLGGIAACILLAVGYNAVMQSRFQRAPNAIVSTPIPSNTSTPDSTQSGIAQTVTVLAQTQSAMFAAPTLTAAVLAPGVTQTALVGEQNGLNTAIAATKTQSGVVITQTAQFAAMTTTAVFQTQIAATVTQQAIAFKGTLNLDFIHLVDKQKETG